tara:strand:+ start:649 stop:1272 length:624 start_codon:yes stop_codon:yes gene_type:complete
LIATISWGNRTSILNSGRRLIKIMENDPYYFIKHFEDDIVKLSTEFKHRTFNDFDLHFFFSRLQILYKKYSSMEEIFSPYFKNSNNSYLPIIKFREEFLGEFDFVRTKKHIANPKKGSAAKRLNMFLRWMVRKDQKGVDFGIWQSINASKLSCPLDIHSGNGAREFGLIKRKLNDWKAVEELDKNLRKLDPNDPVKYDFALFGWSIN